MDSKNFYQKVASHEAKKGEFKKCVLLYSGGLDTSTMLKWISENYDAEIIALTVDVGQLHENLEAAREKALKLGAKKAIVFDAKKEFAEKIISRAIKMNADYQGGYHLSTPLGRVILSEIAVKIAHEENCQVIAHGATGKGNDQVRFESYITTLDENLKIIAPVREWSMGRDEQIIYAQKHGIEIKQTADRPYSYDDNLWGSTGEGGEIEDPKKIPPLEKILQVCAPVEKTPDEPEILEIEFAKGIPTKFNGEKMSLLEIIEKCNSAGARHGIGVCHLIEDRLIGLKVRGVYEAPGAEILIAAHFNLEKLVSTRDANLFKNSLDQKWADFCYAAKWFEPAVGALHAAADFLNERVCGKVKIKIFKGNCTVVAVDSPFSLFDSSLATFNKNAKFNQNASAGFIELWNLAQKTWNKF
jgi:argininosuccinate synthase